MEMEQLCISNSILESRHFAFYRHEHIENRVSIRSGRRCNKLLATDLFPSPFCFFARSKCYFPYPVFSHSQRRNMARCAPKVTAYLSSTNETNYRNGTRAYQWQKKPVAISSDDKYSSGTKYQLQDLKNKSMRQFSEISDTCSNYCQCLYNYHFIYFSY